MIPGLAAGGYRVIVPDMLGFGNSDNPRGYELYEEGQHARRLLQLMDHLSVANWTHVLHDAGGLWTWELLSQSPNRIDRLVILNTLLLEAGFNPPMRMDKGIIARLSMSMYRFKPSSTMLLKNLFKMGLQHGKLDNREWEGYQKPMLEGKTHSMYYFFTQTCNKLPDYGPLFSQLHIPVMVIWGKNDPMLRWEPQKEMVMDAFRLSEKDVHSVDGKHFIQEDFPDEINRLILA